MPAESWPRFWISRSIRGISREISSGPCSGHSGLLPRPTAPEFALGPAEPFKRPLLMIATAALLKSREPARWAFHGRGLGGSANPVSSVIPDTVHQGYAPVVPLRLEPAQ